MKTNSIMQGANTVTKLFGQSCRSAVEMTHILKEVGNGNMQRGIQRVSFTSFKEGVLHGEKTGAVKGATATGGLVLSFFLLVQWIKRLKAQKANAEAIEQEKKVYQQAIDSSSESSGEFSENDEMAKTEDDLLMDGRSTIPHTRQN